MATNKNQHFVPRCYLKAFSAKGEGRAINLYNLDRERAISDAPVKGQCSGDYFYGKDLTVERALQGVEGAYATAIQEISATGYTLTAEHRVLLQSFVCLQHLRTEAASKRSVAMMHAMGEVAGVPAEDYRIEIREAVQDAMSAFGKAVQMVLDLKVCLVRNESRAPFITSDDPAVLANRWHTVDRRAWGKSPGVGSAGALFFLPLSSQIQCVLYDGDVYTIPNVGGWVSARDEADVDALNEHQVLNCRANLYFRNWIARDYVDQIYSSCADRRVESRHRVNYAVFERRDGDHDVYRVVDRVGRPEDERAMVHVSAIYPSVKQWPSFVSWRRPGRVYSNGTGVGFIRQATTALAGGFDYRAFAARGQ